MPDYPNVDEDSFAPSGFADQEFNALGCPAPPTFLAASSGAYQ